MNQRRSRKALFFGMALAGASVLALPGNWIGRGTLASAADQAATDLYVGHFTGDSGMTVDIAGDPEHYTGVIHLNKLQMPLTAHLVDGHVQGTFASGGSNFPFTADVQGTALSLKSGSKTYHLNGAPASVSAAPGTSNAGVGMQIQISDDGAIMISRLIPDGPAARAGVKVGDQLVAIDDKPVHGVQDLAERLPGSAGSTVKLAFRRGQDTPEFTLQRVVFNPPADTPAAPAGKLTLEQIGQALDKYGKNTLTTNGNTSYSLTVTRGKYDINVIVSLSPNHSVIWMTTQLENIPDTSKAAPDALAKLLDRNVKIGPMFFGMVGPNHTVRLSSPVPNHDLTPQAVQDYVEALVSTVLDTEPLWRADVLVPKTPVADNPLSQ